MLIVVLVFFSVLYHKQRTSDFFPEIDFFVFYYKTNVVLH